MLFSVYIEDSDETFTCPEDKKVLASMESAGNRGIQVGCRQGGCGVCKVEVIRGTYRARVMSRAHITEEDEACQRVLACCIWPESDLVIRVLGRKQTTAARTPEGGLR